MDSWSLYEGKFVKIILKDGENHYSKKEGIFKGSDEKHIFLEINSKIESFNKADILRSEEVVR